MSHILTYCNTSLSKGLLNYYKLDGDTVDTIQGNNGIDTSLSFGNGKINSGVIFNGTNSQSVFNDMLPSSAGTLSIWIKPESNPSAARFFYRNGLYFYLFPNDYTLCFDINSTGLYATPIVLIPNQWNYITLTYKSGEFLIYSNGEVKLIDNSFTILNTSSTFVLGSYDGGDYYKGMLDEVGIWNRALSSEEINLIYNKNSGIQHPFPLRVLGQGNNIKDALINYWKFDGNSKDVISGNNGTDTDINYTPSLISSGATFNGTSSRISFNDIVLIPGSSFSFWIFPKNNSLGPFSGLGGIVCDSINGDGLYFYSALPQFQLNMKSNISNAAGVIEVFNVWTHVALIWKSNGELQFYINGKITEGSITGLRTSSLTLNVFGLMAQFNVYLDSTIDEFGIWNRVLTNEEIFYLFNSNRGLEYEAFGNSQSGIISFN